MLNEFPLERKLHSTVCSPLSVSLFRQLAWQCFRWIMMLLKCNLFFFLFFILFLKINTQHNCFTRFGSEQFAARNGSLWLALILTAYCATQRQFVMNFILFYYFSQNCIFRQHLAGFYESYVRCWSLISVLPSFYYTLFESNSRAANKAIINYRTCEP